MMAGAFTVTKKNIAFCIIFLCYLRKTVSTTTANTNGCPDKMNTCQCLFWNEDIDVDSRKEEPRVVGLAAATGALGGVLATGTAFAAYLHFRGSGGGGGGGSPGGGVSSGGSPRAPRSPRLESTASSSDSFDSQSPLTKADRRGEKLAAESRTRPYTGASTASSNGTNIYRHAKVWPGRL